MRLISFLLFASTLASFSQNFSIVSDEVKSQRQATAYRNMVQKTWQKTVEKNTVKALVQFLKKGYNTSHNEEALEMIYNYVKKRNDIGDMETILSYKYAKSVLYSNYYKKHRLKIINKIFQLTTENNTIKKYEEFLAKNYGIRELNKQAISNIYFLTVEADALVGYREFLKKYPKTPEAEMATERIYEIMYAIAEEENEIAAYYGFLVEFPKSQRDLRDKAFINMQMLEVEMAGKQYNSLKQSEYDFELKERIARQLYIEAIRAKDMGDNYTFMRKYNTVLYSDLFKDTKTAFDLYRDKELAKLISQLIQEVRHVNYSVNKMQRALSYKLDQIDHNLNALRATVISSQNDYSPVLDKIYESNARFANDWANYAADGTKPEGFFGGNNSYW